MKNIKKHKLRHKNKVKNKKYKKYKIKNKKYHKYKIKIMKSKINNNLLQCLKLKHKVNLIINKILIKIIYNYTALLLLNSQIG